ncbi:MAG: hypothetical protein OER22_08870 [Gammaproteobacteria bacterium]|nr:hypothetical protein [Gammaproteobacteria bacterium]MDH3408814.1 hypothetical protein [Gammaproteobacteria bacterium]MDH3552710.1 hypothetical protein [Gammaproteobacteria bacterium]
MKAVIIRITIFAALLSGCVSHDGTYAPSCIAYAGSTITLADGQFVWEKFTDEVVVNDDGSVVNQFPGYPLRGKYRIDGQTVLMESVEGESIDKMYLHRHDNKSYLYTPQQFEHWQSTGESAKCALMLDAGSDDG